MRRSTLLTMAALATCALQSGCSIFSPLPLWELAKGAGEAASLAIPYAGSSASITVYHAHATVQAVCIEYNPDTAAQDVVPAIQMELRRHQIESRVYEAGPLTAGTLAYPWRRFAFFDALAAVIWALYAGLLGYFGGKAFEDAPWKGLVVAFGLAIAVTGGIELFRWLRRRNKPATD